MPPPELEPEPEQEPRALPPSSILHVRGIGVDGWDGTPDGKGDYESVGHVLHALEVFSSSVEEHLHLVLPALVRLGIPDRFPDRYGSQEELLTYFGLDADGIAASVMAVLAGREMAA